MDQPRMLIHLPGIENWHTAVELLIEAGAVHAPGRRMFAVTAPLSSGQDDAIRRLLAVDPAITVDVDLSDDAWVPDPAIPDPSGGYVLWEWWAWQVQGKGDPLAEPRRC